MLTAMMAGSFSASCMHTGCARKLPYKAIRPLAGT
jgi:hypothetical protein